METIDPQYGQEEADKIENYINVFYATKVPPPNPPSASDLSFWKISGFETISFFLPSISFAIFSAVRTAGFFFIQEKTLLGAYDIPPLMIWLLSLLVMGTAIMGFEGYMLARGIKQGREQTENKVSWAGTYLTVTVIILVGIFTGIGMIKINNMTKLYIDVGMALVTGISGGIITFFGGNDIGYALKKFDLERMRLQKEFQDNFNGWRESAVRSYFSAHRRTAGTQSSYVHPDAPQQVKMSKLEKAYLFVSNHYAKTKSLPINQIISDNAGVSLGTAYKGLAMFIVKNENELVGNGSVKQEQVIKAHTFLGQAMNQETSAEETISKFISENGRFPDTKDLNEMGVSLDDAIKFVVINQENIRTSALLSDEVIQQAVEKYNEK